MSTSPKLDDELLLGFIDEAVHGLHTLPEQLAEFRLRPERDAAINAVFRAVHSIKGNAGFFSLTAIQKFSHALENTLDEVRNRRQELTEPLQRALIDGFDRLDELFQLLLADEAPNDLGEREQELLTAIDKACAAGASDANVTPGQTLTLLIAEMQSSGVPQAAQWAARLRMLYPAETMTAQPVVVSGEAPPAPPAKAVAEAEETNKAAPTEHAANKSRLVRIKEEHLDSFVGDVSRLFITCERLKDLHTRMSAEKQLTALVDEFKQVNAAFYSQTNALQRSVVALRNVPVQALFSKFPRMARSLANNLGKQLEVQLAGEELGIDKTLVEELDSPLTHMIRNVCDHAIELPADRLKAGKPPAGQLQLKCELTRSHVVITVQDDGRGIDPARLRRKAVETKLLSPEAAAALSDADAIDLIFHAGLSTAEAITEVSGRGVGMDVVRTTLRHHGGDVTVLSKVGIGTTFKLTIPIRQAVLVVDGLLLTDGIAEYVVPLAHIREIVELRDSDLRSVQGQLVADVRGEPLAAIPLTKLLDQPSPPPQQTPWQGVVLRSKEASICMLTQRVIGQRKVVINSLREILPGVERITGVAQLGGGKLALVLSVPDMIRALGPVC